MFSPDAADASAILTDDSLSNIRPEVLVGVALALRHAAGIAVGVHRSIVDGASGKDEVPAVFCSGEKLVQPIVATGLSR